jgi:hypothetical protein
VAGALTLLRVGDVKRRGDVLGAAQCSPMQLPVPTETQVGVASWVFALLAV